MEKEVLIVGPMGMSQGGIATIVYYLINDSEFKERFHIHTLDTRKKSTKSFSDPSHNYYNYFLIFKQLCLLIWFLVFKNIKLVQLYTSSYSSFEKNKLLIKICKLFGRKVVLDIHGGAFDQYLDSLSKKQKERTATVLRRVDAIRVVANYWKEIILKITHTGSNIYVIPNGVKTSLFKHDNIENSNKLDILFVGSMGQRKGILDLLTICPEIFDKHEKSRLVIVGDFEVEKDRLLIEQKIANLNKPTQRVVFMGALSYDKLIEAYSSSFMFVLPSYNENFPMSILEAMSSGLPVISTSVGAIPEVIINMENGFVIKPGDLSSLKEKINILLSNKDLTENIRHNNFEKSKELYDVKKIHKAIFSLYNKLM